MDWEVCRCLAVGTLQDTSQLTPSLTIPNINTVVLEPISATAMVFLPVSSLLSVLMNHLHLLFPKFIFLFGAFPDTSWPTYLSHSFICFLGLFLTTPWSSLSIFHYSLSHKLSLSDMAPTYAMFLSAVTEHIIVQRLYSSYLDNLGCSCDPSHKLLL